MVGAVLVVRGRIVGEGFHRRVGDPHAEINAIEAAAGRCAGSTMYVTLEPCVHHGRTPPCVDAIVTAGVETVVVAMLDPDERVGGKGVKALRKAGLQVEVGDGKHDAALLNRSYIMQRGQGRPFVTYKAAVSLDGRTAAVNGTSRWISGDASRSDVHTLRSAVDAVAVGVGTVLTDDPSLTVRDAMSGSAPIRVVFDSNGRTPLDAAVLSDEAPSIVFVGSAVSDRRVAGLRGAGAQVLQLEGQKVDLKGALRLLAERGVVDLLLEGGAHLAGAFAREGLIDRYVMYWAPVLLGGPNTLGVIDGWEASDIGDARAMQIESIKRIGDDIRVTAIPRGV